MNTVYGRLTVVSRAGSNKWGQSLVQCKCSCGKECVKLLKLLKSGDTRSCGCLSKESKHTNRLTHGKCRTRAYYCWRNMLNRCHWSNGPDFKNYGGRGITVCKEWLQFEGFYRDMGDPPAGHTLERKDNNKGYNKDNCRWATMLDQGKNKRNNNMITLNGETRHLSEWSRITGIKLTTLYMRINRYGWSPERALCV